MQVPANNIQNKNIYNTLNIKNQNGNSLTLNGKKSISPLVEEHNNEQLEMLYNLIYEWKIFCCEQINKGYLDIIT